MTVSISGNIARSQAAIEQMSETVDKMGDGPGQERLRAELAYLLYLAIDDQRKRIETIDVEAFATTLEGLLKKLRDGLQESGDQRQIRREDKDTITKKLYGQAWSVFDEQAFVSASGLFKERFLLNDLDIDFINGADCLDYGCGSGRYCQALLELGANWVHGVDFSPQNIALAKKRITELTDKKNISLREGDITKIFDKVKNEYDFVVAQGVVHHLPDPFGALGILHQVLKPRGQLYLFAYGATGRGLYWRLVDVVRQLLKPVPMKEAQSVFEALEAKKNNIYGILDVGYVPIQHRFRRVDLENIFKDMGFEIVKTMNRGKIYETNERVFRYPQEKEFWGSEALRYLLRKVV